MSRLSIAHFLLLEGLDDLESAREQFVTRLVKGIVGAGFMIHDTGFRECAAAYSFNSEHTNP
jgi:hypothetical protein